MSTWRTAGLKYQYPIKYKVETFLYFRVYIILHACILFSYVNYSNIAAKVLRQSLKSELRDDASRRDQSLIKFTYWTNGEPLGNFLFLLFIKNYFQVITVNYKFLLCKK